MHTMRSLYSEYFVYRTNFLLEFVGPALIFYFVRYSVWSAVYHNQGDITLRGYTFDEMINYQAWSLVVVLLAQSYKGTNLALDIRFGRISSFLLYPFDFWKYHSARFLVFFSLQSGIVAITLLFLVFFGALQLPSLQTLLTGWLLCFLIACFWFAAQFTVGVLAFWLEETWVFRVMLLILAQFASGSFIPFEFFPAWLRSLLECTPFPYLTYYPVTFLRGEVSSLWWVVTNIAIWTGIGSLVARFVWRSGVRNYSAAGI